MKKALKILTIAALLLTISLAIASCGTDNTDAFEDIGENKYGNMPFPLYDSETGNYGYINKTGEWVIEPQFCDAGLFAENGLAAVRELFDIRYNNNGSRSGSVRGGYINEKGEWVIEPKFGYVGDFAPNGLAVVSGTVGDSEDGGYGYINEKGEWVIEPKFDYAEDFAKNGLAVVCDRETDEYGYINEKGEWVIEPQFTTAYDFAPNGLARVGVENLNPKPESLYDHDYYNYGYINEKGKFVIEAKYRDAIDFASNGLAAVRDRETGKWGYINEQGRWAIKPRFSRAESFYSNDCAYVLTDDRGAKFINEQGKIILDRTQRLSASSEGYLIKKIDGEWIFIEKNG